MSYDVGINVSAIVDSDEIPSFKNELGFDNYYFMKRISKCEWCEIPKNELGDYSYAAKYIGANAIVIATYN